MSVATATESSLFAAFASCVTAAARTFSFQSDANTYHAAYKASGHKSHTVHMILMHSTYVRAYICIREYVDL